MNPDLVKAIREGFLTLTLASSGGKIVFARGSEFRLLDGVEGFGPAPVEYTSTPLPGGGGVRRHSRMVENSLHLPIELVGESPADLFRLRRLLESVILADGAATEITVEVASDQAVRSQVAFLDGEGHSYTLGGASSHFTWQKIGLTLTAPDPLWHGEQKSVPWALSPERRQWLSQMRDEPSIPRLVRTNHILNPSMVGDVGREVYADSLPIYQSVESSVSSEHARFGVSSWRFETTATNGTRVGGRLASSASGAIRYAGSVWVRPGVGVEHVRVVMQRTDGASTFVSATQTLTLRDGMVTDEWQEIRVEESTPQVGVRRLAVEFVGGSTSGFWVTEAAIPVGSVSYVDGAVLTDATQPLDFFDGGTAVSGHTTNWVGEPHGSASEVWTEPLPDDDILAVPFGVMALSESTVQGAKELTIEGDADAEAILHITGPGEDLEVINETTGQRIFITGDIDETVVIDSRPGWQDIYSESRQNGEWWEFVSDDAPEELITLRPGLNRVRVTMVNAHPQSRVELLYRQTYMAGH